MYRSILKSQGSTTGPSTDSWGEKEWLFVDVSVEEAEAHSRRNMAYGVWLALQKLDLTPFHQSFIWF